MKYRCEFGKLITPDTKLQRQYFKQMVDLIGVYALFESPKAKDYNQLMQLVDDLEHEECRKHQNCNDKNNPCIFDKNGMCVIFCFSGLLDELSSKNEVSNNGEKAH